MQLFITDFIIEWNQVLIRNKDLLTQIKRVLRLKNWDKFCVQKILWNNILRYTVMLKLRDNKEVFCDIIEKKEKKLKSTISEKTMIISMPNKWSKAEIIVQKLSEIWIQNIVFWPSERSLLKEKNLNKRNRLEKIALEATEQSWNWTIPQVNFITDISAFIKWKAIAVLDIPKDWKKKTLDWNNFDFLLVGPEGGFSESDYKKFWEDFQIAWLWKSVLRMETASIVGGWLLKNE